MAWFAVYRISNGELLSVASVLAPDLAPRGLASVEIANPPGPLQFWNTVTRVFDTIPTPKMIVRKSEFWDRFTDAELENVQAAEDNTAFSAALRRRIKAHLRFLAICDEIDLNNPRVQAIINGMQTLGVIGAGRAAQIIG